MGDIGPVGQLAGRQSAFAGIGLVARDGVDTPLVDGDGEERPFGVGY